MEISRKCAIDIGILNTDKIISYQYLKISSNSRFCKIRSNADKMAFWEQP